MRLGKQMSAESDFAHKSKESAPTFADKDFAWEEHMLDKLKLKGKGDPPLLSDECSQ